MEAVDSDVSSEETEAFCSCCRDTNADVGEKATEGGEVTEYLASPEDSDGDEPDVCCSTRGRSLRLNPNDPVLLPLAVMTGLGGGISKR